MTYIERSMVLVYDRRITFQYGRNLRWPVVSSAAE